MPCPLHASRQMKAAAKEHPGIPHHRGPGRALCWQGLGPQGWAQDSETVAGRG